MKLKLTQLVNCQPALNKITEKELPANLAYKISKISQIIRAELIRIDEVRSNLIRKLGAPIPEQDGRWRVSPENEPAFHTEMEKLLAEETDINITQIKLKDLGDLKFSPQDMSQIDFIFEDN